MFDLPRIANSGLVARIDYHESIGSTSDRALVLGAVGETELPLLVLAAKQTAGRGRGSNHWHAADGALTFSLVLEAPPDRLPPSRWPQVALAAGLAVRGALQALAPDAKFRLKWPNDVFLGNSKICGILSESVPGWKDRLIIGIGINVNNSMRENPSAASLIDHDQLSRDLTSTLITVLDEFDRRWRELLDDQFAALAAAYRHRCLLTGKTVTVAQAGDQTLTGVCHGIDDLGRLKIQTEHGEQTVVSGSVVKWDGC